MRLRKDATIFEVKIWLPSGFAIPVRFSVILEDDMKIFSDIYGMAFLERGHSLTKGYLKP